MRGKTLRAPGALNSTPRPFPLTPHALPSMSQFRRAPRRLIDGVLLLDKPQGLSSNNALQKARWLFNAEKAGHTGTLDPMATGLLPLCFGEATKFSQSLLEADKGYDATILLGVTTDTCDAEGEVLETRPVDVSRGQLEGVLESLTGAIEQIPPMHSALKRDGKPLYELARQGIEVERAPRRITIHRIDLTAFDGQSLKISVACSKGTYIRTLAQDIGAKLGCGAHLTALRRTFSGTLSLGPAISLEALEALSPEERDAHLLPPDVLLAPLPSITISPEDQLRYLQGIPVRAAGEPGPHRAYGSRFLGLAELGTDGWLRPKRIVMEKKD